MGDSQNEIKTKIAIIKDKYATHIDFFLLEKECKYIIYITKKIDYQFSHPRLRGSLKAHIPVYSPSLDKGLCTRKPIE